MNHPNRPRQAGPSAAANPKPHEIRALREQVGLTQIEAADLIHGSYRAWQDWEANVARMHPGLWELFQIKAGLIQAPIEAIEALRTGAGHLQMDALCNAIDGLTVIPRG